MNKFYIKKSKLGFRNLDHRGCLNIFAPNFSSFALLVDKSVIAFFYETKEFRKKNIKITFYIESMFLSKKKK